MNLISCDGESIQVVVMDGPVLTTVIPAPMMTERERADLVERTRREWWAAGYFIQKERQSRNPMFDKHGEKTTTELIVRPCKTEDEARFVVEKVMEIAIRTL